MITAHIKGSSPVGLFTFFLSFLTHSVQLSTSLDPTDPSTNTHTPAHSYTLGQSSEGEYLLISVRWLNRHGLQIQVSHKGSVWTQLTKSTWWGPQVSQLPLLSLSFCVCLICLNLHWWLFHSPCFTLCCFCSSCGSRDGDLLVGPPLWSRRKYLNSY